MSIFTCELMAIFLSLMWLEEFKPNNVVVFVDSLSALQALKSNLFKVKNYLLYDNIFLYNQLVKLGSNVIFEWIPSHVGILGNEIADQTAKRAFNKDTIDCHIPLYKKKTSNV